MKRGDPTGTFCDCLLPDRQLEDGNLYCANCGRQIPEARDRLLVTVARFPAGEAFKPSGR